MKNYLLVYSLLFIFLCSACSENKVSFQIENTSSEQIDSIHIGLSGFNYKKPTEKLTLINSNEKKRLDITFENVPKVDGNYQITVFSGGENKKQSFGYYSNGSPLSKEFNITIDNDTIIFKEIPH